MCQATPSQAVVKEGQRTLLHCWGLIAIMNRSSCLSSLNYYILPPGVIPSLENKEREAPRAQGLGCGEGAQAPQQVVRASVSSGREAACTIIYDINSGGCPATSAAATSSCAGPGAAYLPSRGSPQTHPTLHPPWLVRLPPQHTPSPSVRGLHVEYTRIAK